jgi:6,7-dimethyl-8-ribityllumazine synthase
MKIGIVVSKWNNKITDGLYNGAFTTLIESGVSENNIEKIEVPGSFELIFGAKVLSRKDVDVIICLGSVIQGETKHFDYVCQAVSNGIKDLNISLNIPVIFGVLTDNTMEQAVNRSGGKHGNKGVEAAVTAIKMVHLNQQ